MSSMEIPYTVEPRPDTGLTSGKIGIWTGHGADPPRLFRIEGAVDYWDGEA